MSDLTRNVVSLNSRALDYAVYAGEVDNYEVWLVRGGYEKVVRVFGSYYSDLAHSAALRYRLVRSVALGMGWRP